MKSFKITLFLTVLTTFVFSSCGAVRDCDDTGGEFFRCIKEERVSDVIKLIDAEALKVSPENVWIECLEKKAHKAGQLLSSRRIDFETLTTDRVTRVGIWYKNVYSETELFEKLEFVEREDGFKITYYNFDEDSLAVR